MSFALTNRFIRPLFARRFYLLLALFWISLLLFRLLLLSGTQYHLQDQQLSQLHQQVNAFLDKTKAELLGHHDLIEKSAPRELNGLDFIILKNGGEHFLLTGASKQKINFHALMNLPLDFEACWVSLDDTSKEGNWVIVSQKLSEDISLQAGQKSGELGRSLYHKVKIVSLLAALFCGTFSILLAYLLTIQNQITLQKIINDLSVSLAKGSKEFEIFPQDGELAEIYDMLNQLFSKNRKLIKAMQESLDSVAHDLRTPMTRLRSVAEYGLQTERSNEEYQDILSDCLEESERVLSILKIMMSVAEAEAGTIQLHFEKVDLTTSLKKILALYEYVADEKTISLTSELTEDLYLSADGARMGQVWANLLDNAIKYTGPRGKVSIESEKKRDKLIIRFIDNGSGISESEHERIWERLYRGDRSRSQPGLGLGLSYVRPIVEAHGGRVTVISSLEKGAIFTVELPAYPED